MTNVATIENADMARREAMDERPQDQLAGRGKFAWCRDCGSQDGMQAVHYEVVASLSVAVVAFLVPWFSEPGNDEELFYPCHTCNPGRNIPDGYEPLGITDVTDWASEHNPMAPDYDALAAEEPVLASQQIGTRQGWRDDTMKRKINHERRAAINAQRQRDFDNAIDILDNNEMHKRAAHDALAAINRTDEADYQGGKTGERPRA